MPKHSDKLFVSSSFTAMHHLAVIVCVTTALLTYKLAVCEWTFSLRIHSAQCCENTTCEQVGVCSDLLIVLCFRDPNTTMEDQSCPYLIVGYGRDIGFRQLTPADFFSVTNQSEAASIPTAYQGGFQINLRVRESDSHDIIDELFFEIVSEAGGEEISSVPGLGERGKASITLSSISVQCSAGYGGEDCDTCREDTTCNLTLGYCNSGGECICHDRNTECVLTNDTVYMCSEDITCNLALGYCNSEGECICHDGSTECAGIHGCSEDITCNLALGYCNSEGKCICRDGNTECTEVVVPTSTASENGGGRDLAPILAGVVVVVVLLLVIIIIIIVITLLYKRNEKKKAEMTVLTGPLDTSSTTSSSSAIPLYANVNKDKKRRSPPDVPQPYQVAMMSANEIVEDVTHATTLPTQNPDDSSELSNGEALAQKDQGLVYAALDLHCGTETAAAPPKRPDMTLPSLSNAASSVTYSTINPYSKPRTPPKAADGSGEVAYYSIIHAT